MKLDIDTKKKVVTIMQNYYSKKDIELIQMKINIAKLKNDDNEINKLLLEIGEIELRNAELDLCINGLLKHHQEIIYMRYGLKMEGSLIANKYNFNIYSLYDLISKKTNNVIIPCLKKQGLL